MSIHLSAAGNSRRQIQDGPKSTHPLPSYH